MINDKENTMINELSDDDLEGVSGGFGLNFLGKQKLEATQTDNKSGGTCGVSSARRVDMGSGTLV